MIVQKHDFLCPFDLSLRYWIRNENEPQNTSLKNCHILYGATSQYAEESSERSILPSHSCYSPRLLPSFGKQILFIP